MRDPGQAPAGRRIAIIGTQAFAMANFRGPLIRDLVASGHRVWALAPDYDEAMREQVRALGAEPLDYPLARASISPIGDLRAMWRLWRLLRRIRPDALLCYFIKGVIYGTLAGWLAGVPRRVALIEGAGYVFADAARYSWGRRLLRRAVTVLYRFALHRAHRVFVLNREDLRFFLDARMVPPERIRLLPGIGVDLQHYRVGAPLPEPVTFCLAARLIVEKGVRVFAEAAREVKRRHPEVRFVLLGSVDENPGSLEEAEIRGWVDEGLLEWPGHVPDVRPYLGGCSAFVLPSHYREGLPRSILEAMAMGRPVITTDNPGCRDAVVDGENGFVVPMRDARALAEAMRRLIERPELIPELGAAGRARAERLYDVRAINGQLLASLDCS